MLTDAHDLAIVELERRSIGLDIAGRPEEKKVVRIAGFMQFSMLYNRWHGRGEQLCHADLRDYRTRCCVDLIAANSEDLGVEVLRGFLQHAGHTRRPVDALEIRRTMPIRMGPMLAKLCVLVFEHAECDTRDGVRGG
jgi:hypothetical protein